MKLSNRIWKGERERGTGRKGGREGGREGGGQGGREGGRGGREGGTERARGKEEGLAVKYLALEMYTVPLEEYVHTLKYK